MTSTTSSAEALRVSQQRRRSSAGSANSTDHAASSQSVSAALSGTMKRTSFSVASMKSIDSKNSEFGKLFIVDKITSSLYSRENPPRDWADISFLIPHEAIRREMAAMTRSITKLNNGSQEDGKEHGFQPWQAVYFCEWFADHFTPAILDHHHNEEEIYFPWVATKATLPGEKKLSDGHEELITKLSVIGIVCEKVITSGGESCTDELMNLKVHMLELEKHMLEHLKEEEADIPPILRAHFTKEEEDHIIQKIGQSGGVSGLRLFFPTIILAMKEWATPVFYDEFMSSLPPPIRNLMVKYILPDEINCVVPKRDAPFLDEEPSLDRVKCCRVAFCGPCII